MINNEPKTLEGTLEGTLPPEKTLPETQPTMDQLSMLRMALGQVSNYARKSGIKSGVQTMVQGLENQGLTMEGMGGNVLTGIMDFVDKQVSSPIESEFKNLENVIEKIQTTKNQVKDDARSAIQLSVNMGTWNNMSFEQRKSLWNDAGYIGDPLLAEKKSEAGDTVGWSEWAANLGIVGAPVQKGMEVAMNEAKRQDLAEKDRALASVRANIFNYINAYKGYIDSLNSGKDVEAKNTPPTREQLIDQFVANKSFSKLTRDEIATEVYGLTKELESIKLAPALWRKVKGVINKG